MCYRLALEMKPDDAQVHCNLGNALRQLGLLDEAIASSARAIALDPALSVAHNNLALCLAARGQREEAVGSYRQALLLNPGYIEALNNLGNALSDLGERRVSADVALDPSDDLGEHARGRRVVGAFEGERRVGDGALGHRFAFRVASR